MGTTSTLQWSYQVDRGGGKALLPIKSKCILAAFMAMDFDAVAFSASGELFCILYELGADTFAPDGPIYYQVGYPRKVAFEGHLSDKVDAAG
jgi:hypothetical protein